VRAALEIDLELVLPGLDPADPAAHQGADPGLVEGIKVEPGVPDRELGADERELDKAVKPPDLLFVEVGLDLDVGLGGDLDREFVGVGVVAGDPADPALARELGLVEGLGAHADRGHRAEAGDDDAGHPSRAGP